MFIAALLTTARTWKQPKCPSTGKWIKEDVVQGGMGEGRLGREGDSRGRGYMYTYIQLFHFVVQQKLTLQGN